MSTREAVTLMGLPLDLVDVAKLHETIRRSIAEKRKSLILNLNIHCVNLASRQPWLRDFLREAALVFCDGDGVRLGLKLLGIDPPPKITYDRWIWQLAEFSDQNRYQLYFVGARPGVAEDAARNLKNAFPGLQIAGTAHGYFQKEGEESEKLIHAINRVLPDILIVGFGMPLQEKWLFDNWHKIDARVFLTGGAVFDYASGRIKRAPEWMIRLHLEWLFRFLQEPRRLFGRYVWGIPYFFWTIFKEKLKGNKLE